VSGKEEGTERIQYIYIARIIIHLLFLRTLDNNMALKFKKT